MRFFRVMLTSTASHLCCFNTCLPWFHRPHISAVVVELESMLDTIIHRSSMTEPGATAAPTDEFSSLGLANLGAESDKVSSVLSSTPAGTTEHRRKGSSGSHTSNSNRSSKAKSSRGSKSKSKTAPHSGDGGE
jgi:hypothetical protein